MPSSRPWFLLCLALTFGVHTDSVVAGNSTSRNVVRIKIFHTNDIHGYISGRTSDHVRTGGLPLLAGVLNRERYRSKKLGEVNLYVDAGDLFKGTPVVDATSGRCMIDLLNQLGLDAFALGNHEFDYGVPNLDEALDEAKFPILAANLHCPSGLLTEIKPSVLFEFPGVTIGIVGVLTEDTPQVTSATDFHGATFSDPIVAAREEAASLRKQGADIVIGLSHLGMSADIDLIKKVETLDGVIGGHTHNLLERPIFIKRDHGQRVFVAQAGAYAQNLGWISLIFDPKAKQILSVKGGVIRLDQAGLEPNRKVADKVEEYEAPIREIMEQPIGELAESLGVGRRGLSSPIGEMVAEAMRVVGKGDFAFANYGGFRRPLEKGKLIREDIHTLMPFGNKVVKLRMYGKDIREMLDRMISGIWVPVPDEQQTEGSDLPGGQPILLPDASTPGFLVGAGLTVTFDPRLPPRKRRCQIATPKSPFDDGKIYTVIVADFLARGGDGFTEFTRARSHREMDFVCRDAFEKYIKTHAPLSPLSTRSIINLSAEPTR